jgi:LPXTG-site transpeptidase (sortase) family protein
MSKLNIKKYLSWYIYPLIYFVVSGLVCLYAWFGDYPKAHVKIAFKTITVIPTILGVVIITILILSITLVSIVSVRSRKETGIITKEEKEVSKPPLSMRRKLLNSAIYFSGTLLVVAGIVMFIWVTRPYIALLLSSSKIEALEQKVTTGQVQGNRIIIPSILVDAPILEGATESQMARAVCHHKFSSFPGEGGNCIIEGHNLAEFGWWKPQSFFSLLEVISKGEPIYLFYKGKRYVYRVKDKTYKSITDPTLYDTSPGERLTLITCVSTWSPTIYSSKRTVITAYPEF